MDTSSSPRTPRVAPASGSRRISLAVLIGGSVVALAAAFGSVWVVRGGVAIALVSAVVACVYAYREIFVVRRQHAAETLEASKRHGAVLSEERTRNASVVDSLTGRVEQARVVIEGQQVTIAKLTSEVSSLHGDRAHLRNEIAHRDGVISSLRETVRSREAELLARHEDAHEADVHHLPRRVLAEHESAWQEVPAADELWTEGSHPTVVDLKMMQGLLDEPAARQAV